MYPAVQLGGDVKPRVPYNHGEGNPTPCGDDADNGDGVVLMRTQTKEQAVSSSPLIPESCGHDE